MVDLSRRWLSFIEEHDPNVILVVYDGRNGMVPMFKINVKF